MNSKNSFSDNMQPTEKGMHSQAFFDFIHHKAFESPLSLRLHLDKNKYDFDIHFAINQIECRKKYATKFKEFLSNPYFLFPDLISPQQASHPAVSNFHAQLVGKINTVADLTAGLGIDSLAFASVAKEVLSVELDNNKALILKHNTGELGIRNIQVINEDAIDFIQTASGKFDVIFIDPSRRDGNLNRVYNLADCNPDVIKFSDLLIEKTQRIFIKASPLLDISQTLKDFKLISSIRAIGVKGECKELLIELNPNTSSTSDVLLEAVDLEPNGEVISRFSTFLSEIDTKSIPMASIADFTKGKFILEPSAMLLKLVPWNVISEKYNAKKLSPSSHLFIAEEKPLDFPGRISEFNKFITKKDRKTFNGFPAISVSKNHPLTSDEVRKFFSLKEGDSNVVYATRINQKPVFFLTSIIKICNLPTTQFDYL